MTMLGAIVARLASVSQSETDMKRELELLRREVEQLRNRLEALEQTVTALELEIRSVGEEADLGGH